MKGKRWVYFEFKGIDDYHSGWNSVLAGKEESDEEAVERRLSDIGYPPETSTYWAVKTISNEALDHLYKMTWD